MGKNSVTFYVKKKNIKDVNRLKEVVQKLNTTYEDCNDEYTGAEYYKIIVTRPNYHSMSNGTSARLDDLKDDIPIDEYVKMVKDYVDNII